MSYNLKYMDKIVAYNICTTKLPKSNAVDLLCNLFNFPKLKCLMIADTQLKSTKYFIF